MAQRDKVLDTHNTCKKVEFVVGLAQHMRLANSKNNIENHQHFLCVS